MNSSLFLALICCTLGAEQPKPILAHLEATLGQLDSLHVAVEATPTELYVGDVIFVRVSVTNNGKEAVVLPGWFSRFLGNMFLSIYDRKGGSSFTLRPYGHGMGGADPREVKPDERWFLSGYSAVNVPRIESTGKPFWNPQEPSEDGYYLSASLSLARRVRLVGSGSTLDIRPRPKAELAKLREICGMRSAAGRDLPPNWDFARPTLNWFAFPLAPPQASTTENLATLEAVLSPGTLRDLVLLTSRAQAVYDAVEVEQRRKNLNELLNWLETLPEIQRKYMASQFMGWAEDSHKKLGVFGYRMAVETALRPSLWDKDLEARRTWLKRRLADPLAAPLLKDFEERMEAVEK